MNLQQVQSSISDQAVTTLIEFAKDWDKGINILLFGAREGVQESLSFSLAEFLSNFWRRNGWVILCHRIWSTACVNVIWNYIRPVSWLKLSMSV